MSRTITIIGGGFSGTVTGVNLARLTRQALRVVVVNSGRPFGRGVAYGTPRSEHLLNVAARNMSAFPDHPTHFVDWLQTRSDFSSVALAELRERFIPRRIYGDYLRSLAEAYQRPIDPHQSTQIEVIEDEAVDIEPDRQGGARVLLRSGEPVDSNAVLLATGNQQPAAIQGAGGLSHDRRYAGNPWGDWQQHLPSSDGRIVLLGTGLTMVDVVVTLQELGWEGEIVAISRNGLLPRSHFRGIAYPDYLPADSESLGLEDLAMLVELHCGKIQKMSQNPGIAVDKLRPHTQKLWQGFSTEEKRLFLAQHAARWNVVRHRIAQSIHGKVTDALDLGRLKVLPGRIDSVTSESDGLVVSFESETDGATSVSGDLVINCTGPQTSFSRTDCPLFQNLLRRGLVRADSLDMGIEATKEFQAVNADGNAPGWLLAMGTLLKGSLWETTAVPELRVQALQIARALVDSDSPAHIEEDPVIEYCI